MSKDVKILSPGELEYFTRYLHREHPGGAWHNPYEGFKYFSEDTIRRSFVPKTERYDPSQVTLLERCDTPEDVGLAVTSSKKLLGILYCRWGKWNDSFWAYGLAFVDVHKEYRRKGIARSLFRALDETPFLQSKILKLTHFDTPEGAALSTVISEELKAKSYALVPADYYGGTPTLPGRYCWNGERLKPGVPFKNGMF
jgi:hypothetical protein